MHVIFFFFYLIGHDQCCHLLCSTWRMLNMTQIKDQGPENFVTCEFILGKEAQPSFSFCLSPGEGKGCSQSFWKAVALFSSSVKHPGYPANTTATTERTTLLRELSGSQLSLTVELTHLLSSGGWQCALSDYGERGPLKAELISPVWAPPWEPIHVPLLTTWKALGPSPREGEDLNNQRWKRREGEMILKYTECEVPAEWLYISFHPKGKFSTTLV